MPVVTPGSRKKSEKEKEFVCYVFKFVCHTSHTVVKKSTITSLCA